jgi:hypothetical protein
VQAVTGKGIPIMRRQLGNVVMLLVSLCVGVVCVELGLRYYFYGNLGEPSYYNQLYEAHPTRGWAAKPNLKTQLQELDFSR